MDIAHIRMPSSSVNGVTIICVGGEVENQCDWYLDVRADNNGVKLREETNLETASTRYVELGCLREMVMRDLIGNIPKG